MPSSPPSSSAATRQSLPSPPGKSVPATSSKFARHRLERLVEAATHRLGELVAELRDLGEALLQIPPLRRELVEPLLLRLVLLLGQRIDLSERLATGLEPLDARRELVAIVALRDVVGVRVLEPALYFLRLGRRAGRDLPRPRSPARPRARRLAAAPPRLRRAGGAPRRARTSAERRRRRVRAQASRDGRRAGPCARESLPGTRSRPGAWSAGRHRPWDDAGLAGRALHPRRASGRQLRACALRPPRPRASDFARRCHERFAIGVLRQACRSVGRRRAARR